jgi:RpiB/LacA/LacB family sugar-phosphate isomerase
LKVAVAPDHAGASIRKDIVAVIRNAGHQAIVLGAELNRPDDDYPTFAKLVGDAIAAGRAERAVLICGSGAGVTVAANKLPGVRACVAHDVYSAHQDPRLSKFEGRVSNSGEGRWTIMAAIDEGVPAHVLSSALYERFSSRGDAEFADKLLSAMRHEFGGHIEKHGS